MASIHMNRTATAHTVEELLERKDYDEAFARLLEDYSGVIGRLCMALLGNQSDAEDALQDTFVEALKCLSTYRGTGTVRSWLYAIARRQCFKRIAKSRKSPALKLVSDPEVGDTALQRLHHRQLLSSALLSIKPSEREAVLLRYQSDLSYEEISEVLAIAPDAARKRVSRALINLRVAINSLRRDYE